MLVMLRIILGYDYSSFHYSLYKDKHEYRLLHPPRFRVLAPFVTSQFIRSTP